MALKSLLEKLRAARAVGAAVALLFAGLTASAAIAQEEEENRTFSPRAGEIVLEAQTALSAEPPNYQSALDALNRAMNLDGLTPYERSIVLQLRGTAYYELDQPARTLQDFEAARATGALTPDEDLNLLFNIGQLYLQQENYSTAAQRLETWLTRGGRATDQVHLNLVVAYSEMGQMSRALPHGRRAYELASPRQRRHYDVLNYLYTELNMPRERAQILQEMVQLFPQDRSIWLSIAALYAESGRESRAFEINKIMYINGMLNTEQEIMRIVDYYSFYDVPYRGAMILQREMNAGRVSRSQRNLEKLARLFRQAREFDRAIAPLTAAAQSSGDGELFQQLGEAYYSEGELPEAENALMQAVNRGGLQRTGNAWVVIGNARYEQGDREGAVEAFREGLEYPYSRRTAAGWISFIEAEIEAIERRIEFERETQRETIRVACRRLVRDEVLLQTRLRDMGDEAYFVTVDPEIWPDPVDCRDVGNGSFFEHFNEVRFGSEDEEGGDGEASEEGDGASDEAPADDAAPTEEEAPAEDASDEDAGEEEDAPADDETGEAAPEEEPAEE